MAKRFHIYVLIDNSLSTPADAAQMIDDLLVTLFQTVNGEPYLLETAYISILKVGGEPKVILPSLAVTEFSDIAVPP